MIDILVISLIFIVAVSMTLVGKGGGNFYVVILIFSGISIYEASSTGQFILFCASLAGMIVFGKRKAVIWEVALPIGTLIAISAFAGGYLSYLFEEVILKMFFASFLITAGILMLVPYSRKESEKSKSGFGYLNINANDDNIVLDIRVVVPITLLTGFFSGMIGVSGGSFLVPMLVLACGMPMKTSVTTVTPLVTISALLGFSGHALQGHFDLLFTLPLAVVTVIGGILGGIFALKSKPMNLKQIFAITNVIAALLIILNLLQII